jgi:hypothetical protein
LYGHHKLVLHPKHALPIWGCSNWAWIFAMKTRGTDLVQAVVLLTHESFWIYSFQWWQGHEAKPCPLDQGPVVGPYLHIDVVVTIYPLAHR